MKEYIEREALLNALKEERKNGNFVFTSKWIKEIMDNLPTADVVEIVRCKDCENCKTCTDGEKYCELHSDGWGDDLHYVDDDGYCSCGVRKDK